MGKGLQAATRPAGCDRARAGGIALQGTGGWASTVAAGAGDPQGVLQGVPGRGGAGPRPVRGRADRDAPTRAAARCYGNGAGHAPRHNGTMVRSSCSAPSFSDSPPVRCVNGTSHRACALTQPPPSDLRLLVAC